jgi:DNA-directed RNA polymerase subunit beta
VKKQVEAIKNYELGMHPADDVDFWLPTMNRVTGVGANVIPLPNAVQPTRVFYGARFTNQAQPVKDAEVPLVQAAMDEEPSKSFDDLLGKHAGAVFADETAHVADVKPDSITLQTAKGKKQIGLYRFLPFNRYSGLVQTPVVNKGDVVTKGQPLAKSNFTDKNGTLAMGLNARVGLVPYKGFSMDDAVVASQSFANRATSHHVDTITQEFTHGDLKPGRDHFTSLFPETYTQDQLGKLDNNGVVQVGQIVHPGDPLILATRPRNFNSANSPMDRLGKVARQQRADASVQWEEQDPGRVVHVVRKPDGSSKVVVESFRPMRKGDKMALRSGAKGILSKIIPDEDMPRTADGKPLELLLNQQGIPSRANPSLVWEVLLGKAAAQDGKPMKLPTFNGANQSWADFVQQQLQSRGLTDKETVFDPHDNRPLEQPITVGNAYVLKLHHIATKKMDSRGQAGYDQDGLPAKGSGPGGGSKRRSGLESIGMLSSGALNNLRESATLTGANNPDFWREFRAGQIPRTPGAPFVWQKFRALLQGAGLQTRDLGDGRLRLGFMTDKDLDALQPVQVRNGKTIHFRTLAPEPGGLFDPAMVGAKRWGYVPLHEPMPNPAAADTLRALLGLNQREFEEVLAGRKSLNDIQ